MEIDYTVEIARRLNASFSRETARLLAKAISKRLFVEWLESKNVNCIRHKVGYSLIHIFCT